MYPRLTVLVKVALGLKAKAAVIAWVRPLTRMCAKMFLKNRWLGTYTIAKLTNVFTRLIHHPTLTQFQRVFEFMLSRAGIVTRQFCTRTLVKPCTSLCMQGVLIFYSDDPLRTQISPRLQLQCSWL